MIKTLYHYTMDRSEAKRRLIPHTRLWIEVKQPFALIWIYPWLLTRRFIRQYFSGSTQFFVSKVTSWLWLSRIYLGACKTIKVESASLPPMMWCPTGVSTGTSSIHDVLFTGRQRYRIVRSQSATVRWWHPTVFHNPWTVSEEKQDCVLVLQFWFA